MTNTQQQPTRLLLSRQRRQAQYFAETLGDGVVMDMVSIPTGTFLMGSPEDEPERSVREGPQHEVSIQSFFLGKYPVTQAQWRAVAVLPQRNRELAHEPSRFKGDNLPVESVSRLDAVEFCDRLSHQTKRLYRLPSEAEWEYACRAGTTTPFHFGETISTDLANYRGTDKEELKWSGSYGRGSEGTYREQTTEVDSFGVANAFGLYDMHGNVLEWCADHWHQNYEGAPTDGRAWVDETLEEKPYWLLRGGSWDHTPRYCRSAYRLYVASDARFITFGFRVVCA